MKILIDIKHPAHVHFFKNAIYSLKKEGNEVLITARDKEMTLALLKEFGIPYIKISKIGKSKLALLAELFLRNYRFFKIAKKFKPDLMLELMGVTAAPIGKILNIPTLVFYDTENAKLTNPLAYFFCTEFITPNCYKKNMGKKHLKYNGYHELAYLHPKYFQPDVKILEELNIKESDTFTIVRFVSWGASHDIAHKGLTIENKIKAVEEFAKYGKVFITSEKNLPDKLKKYQLNISHKKIHSLLYYTTLIYGESATMSSEAAILGTQAIYINNAHLGYLEEINKKYELIHLYKETKNNQTESIKDGVRILKNKKTKNNSKLKSIKLLNEKINVTDFIIKKIKEYEK